MRMIAAAATLGLVLASTAYTNAQVGSGPRIEIRAFEWGFEPNVIVLEEGKPVTLVFVNTGRLPHNLTSSYLNSQKLRVTGTFSEGVFQPDNWRFIQAPSGQRFEVSFTPNGRPKEGQAVFICSVADGRHAAAGLSGAFVIRRP